MGQFYSDAGEVMECAEALANDFDDEEGTDANCACFNAMGEDYRSTFFNCSLPEIPISLMDYYNMKCVSTGNLYHEKFVSLVVI